MILVISSHQKILKPMKLTAGDVEQSLIHYPFTGSGRIKDDSIEKTFVPIVASVFMRFVFDYDRIPTEDELWQAYTETYLDQKHDGYVIKDTFLPKHQSKQLLNRNGLQARVLRAYPSLIRDVHFYLMCKESRYLNKVKYSLKTDLYDGIDLFVDYEGQTFGISCFTQTARSQQFKEKKYRRHNYNHIQEICVEMDLSKGFRAGNFRLFHHTHLEFMIQQMIQKKPCA